MSKTATPVGEWIPWVGRCASLYRCDPPMEGHEYVLVVIGEPLAWADTLVDVFILPSDSDGNPANGGALLAATTGKSTNHQLILAGVGYQMTGEAND